MCVCVCVCVCAGCLTTAKTKQRIFSISPVDFILFLFSYHHWEIVKILIQSTISSEIMLRMTEQKMFCIKTCYETKSFKIDQARYKWKFSFSTFPNRIQIFKLVKNVETHDTCEDHKATGSSSSRLPVLI